jgi:hypothetical protein
MQSHCRRLAIGLAAGALLALGAAVPAGAQIPRIDVRASGPIRDQPRTPARLIVGGRAHRVEIEVRGETSQRAAKKSYAFEARRKLRLLGMPAERDWVLNAVSADPSLLRDVLAHAAARRLGLAGSRTRHVELRINGRPRGVYVVLERAELSESRVQGEALVELTDPVKLDRDEEWFRSATGHAVRYVEPDEAAKPAAAAARRAVEALEAAFGGPAWRRHLDERSAVDYVLVSELFGNSDAFQASTYVHLRTAGMLAMGPVWDFDRSAGGYVPPEYKAPEGRLVTDRRWGAALLADLGFRAALAARWRQVRPGLLRFLDDSAERHTRRLRGPARRNRERWPRTAPHRRSVDQLQAWLVRRAAWLDSVL